MRPDSPSEERIEETYRSVIATAMGGLKALSFGNGGAVIAIISFVGSLDRGAPTDRPAFLCFAVAVAFYSAGLVACLFAYLMAYSTQLRLYQEMTGIKQGNVSSAHLKRGRYAAGGSLVAFVLGSISAVIGIFLL